MAIEPRSTQDHASPSWFSSVRWKLTAAFLAIIALFSLATLASERGLHGLRDSLDGIHGETLPLVLALQEVGIRIPEIVRLAGAVPEASGPASLAELEASLAKERSELNTAVGACGSSARDLEPLLAQIETNVAGLIQAQGERIALAEEVARCLATFEGFARDLAEELEGDLILAESAGESVESIRGLRMELLSLAVELRAVPDAQNTSELAGAERTYELARRNSVRLMTGLRGESRTERAAALQSLLQGARVEGNILEAQGRYLQAAKAVAVEVAAGRDLGDQLQARAATLVRNSKATIDTSHSSANGAAERARWVVLALWFSALVFSGLILWLYVRGRVLRRLEQIANDLTSLSDGQLDIEVRGGGDRELAQLASAAEIFRQNAIELDKTLRTLEAKNSTLTEFANVASHDLKSPMRSIANLAVWIRDDAEEILSDESKGHLNLMADRIAKMETLLEDLLRYSRLGTDEKMVEELSLADVVHGVIDLLALPEGAEVRCQGVDRTVRTIAAPLKLCLRNLIQNAVAHTDRAEPTVKVTVQPIEGESALEIVVEDDGPGIPEHQREEAARIFRKLDHGGEGTGMGLALTKRAVELIGGSFAIESAQPRGARIVLVWPLAEARP